jgi:hypothetical protein
MSGSAAASVTSASRAVGTQMFPVGPQEGIILRHTADGWVLVA